MSLLRVTVLLGMLALPVPAAVGAEPPPHAAPAPESDVRKVLRPGEVEIRGKVRKPKPPPITPPNVSMRQDPERRRSFLPKIVEAVDEEPFQERTVK
jgi:hypothetical protein